MLCSLSRYANMQNVTQIIEVFPHTYNLEYVLPNIMRLWWNCVSHPSSFAGPVVSPALGPNG